MPTTHTKSAAPFTTKSPAAAYKHFLPAAKALPADAVRPCSVDVDIIRTNIGLGLAALKPQIKVVKAKLRKFPFAEVEELPALGLALTFAADRVGASASTGEIGERLAAVRPMRDITLRQLEILAELRFAPADRVRAIRAGGGSIDTARDAVAIAALFHEIDGAIANKHPFTPAYLKQMSEHGEWLLARLKPEAGNAAPAAPDPAAGVRDRIFTLVSARYDLLREAGVAAFGLKALDEHVPPLGSRAASRPAAPADPKKPAAPA